jgi:hypothetical protein
MAARTGKSRKEMDPATQQVQRALHGRAKEMGKCSGRAPHEAKGRPSTRSATLLTAAKTESGTGTAIGKDRGPVIVSVMMVEVEIETRSGSGTRTGRETGTTRERETESATDRTGTALAARSGSVRVTVMGGMCGQRTMSRQGVATERVPCQVTVRWSAAVMAANGIVEAAMQRLERLVPAAKAGGRRRGSGR